ncbi:glycine cleavage system protein GcvH [Kibdelosporangium philippinense]|uniref:Glycine cleavage system H protein n=1 Tax=Kibdelosporangium philippinense TaxID=211113 RepID=A0ABS8ZWJ4_9PSEU|nr:glycine cleavage system protein GcvH [Kibdelosporangium philippinense]MCE7012076.1 glycine cleavage system protein GcvH [Kibdelosporangium philippinense]
MTPEELKYTPDHEWIAVNGDTVRVGITDFAQEQLGDVVFVQLPEVGGTVSAKDSVGEVESTKSVSEIYAPLGGEVVAVNETLNDTPELINSDPFGDGWMFELKISNSAELGDLLDAAAYGELTGQA